jgi:hypothetical protein
MTRMTSMTNSLQIHYNLYNDKFVNNDINKKYEYEYEYEFDKVK